MVVKIEWWNRDVKQNLTVEIETETRSTETKTLASTSLFISEYICKLQCTQGQRLHEATRRLVLLPDVGLLIYGTFHSSLDTNIYITSLFYAV